MSDQELDIAKGKAAETIDLKTLVKRLPSNTVGQFEPVSGVMVLNIDAASYMATAQRWAKGDTTQADRELINTINHETFHFVQTTLTGYMFNRAKRLLSTLNDDDQDLLNALDKAEQEANKILAGMLAVAGDDEALQERANHVAIVTYYQERTRILHNNAAPSDHSLAGAFMPHFFSFRDQLLEQESQEDERGLSILGVVEGAAVVYTAHLMRDERSVEQRIEDDIVHMPALYSQAWRCAKAALGEKAALLFLPAAAISLCYEQPNSALHWVLQELSGLPLDAAYSRAQQLFTQQNSVPGAGAFLATGWDIREQDDNYRLYDSVLKAWDCEDRMMLAFSLLSEPMALNEMNNIPLCLTLSDNFITGQVPKDEAHAKICIASLVLKVVSRRREEKDYQRFVLKWGRSVIDRLINGLD